MTMVANAAVPVTYVDYEDGKCSTGAKVPYVNVYTHFPTTSQRCAKISNGDHILTSEECLNGKVVATARNCATSLCSECGETWLETYTYTSTDYDKFLAGDGQCYLYTVTRRGFSDEWHFQETATHSGFSGAVQNVCHMAGAPVATETHAAPVATVKHVEYQDSKCSVVSKPSYVNAFTSFPTTSQGCIRLASGDHLLVSKECLDGQIVASVRNCATSSSCSNCGEASLETYTYSSADYDKFLAGDGQCYSYTLSRRGFSEFQVFYETAIHSGFSGAAENVCRSTAGPSAASGSEGALAGPLVDSGHKATTTGALVASGSRRSNISVLVLALAAAFGIFGHTIFWDRTSHA